MKGDSVVQLVRKWSQYINYPVCKRFFPIRVTAQKRFKKEVTVGDEVHLLFEFSYQKDAAGDGAGMNVWCVHSKEWQVR